MLLDIHDWICTELAARDIEATADQRDIHAPGCFVTVTRLSDWTLDYTGFTVHGHIIAMTRDNGGREDLRAKDELLRPLLRFLATSGATIKELSTTEIATPPDSSPLPAVKIEFTLDWTDDT